MFRAQTNQFDEVVVKATDENLTQENWALILDVCDRVSTSPSGPPSAVAALIKRLAHRNANVQIYTLELANALSQNCGPTIHRELASRSFTDALLRLANDRNTHQQVKAKVLERMQGWTEMFSQDPDLGIMAQACEKLRRGNPGLEPPSKPQKHTMEDADRKKEEEELQMALALSLREKSAATNSTPKEAGPSGAAAASSSAATNTETSPDQSALQRGTTAATVSRVRALYDFSPTETGELAFAKGDIIAVLESVYKDWWKGSLRGDTGIFPLNYVEKLQDPTPQELEQDAEMEADVFGQIRNVERLLALLSTRDGRTARADGSEEEITELYNQTLAIRPKLIELIGKYSQKKEDFTSLNEKFIKARRDYEALLDSSMSQPYARPPPQGQLYPAQYGAPPQQYGGFARPAQSYAQQGRPPQMQGREPVRPYSTAPLPQHHQHMGYPPTQHQPDYTTSDGTPPPFHFLPGGTIPDAQSQSGPAPGFDHGLSANEPSYESTHQGQSGYSGVQPYNPNGQNGPGHPGQRTSTYQQPTYFPAAKNSESPGAGSEQSPPPLGPQNPPRQLPFRQRTMSNERHDARQSYIAPETGMPQSHPPPPPQLQPQPQSYPAPPQQVYSQGSYDGSTGHAPYPGDPHGTTSGRNHQEGYAPGSATPVQSQIGHQDHDPQTGYSNVHPQVYAHGNVPGTDSGLGHDNGQSSTGPAGGAPPAPADDDDDVSNYYR